MLGKLDQLFLESYYTTELKKKKKIYRVKRKFIELKKKKVLLGVDVYSR